MGSCEVTPPPRPPFRRLYHLTTAAFATSNIALQRVKVARWADLNDPFELRPYATNSPMARKLIAQFKQSIDKSDGLLCLTRDWTNPLLWSHYGDKHRGVALGFDVDTTALEPTAVRYSAERLAGAMDVEDLLYTKAADWKYEEELRVLVDLRGEVKEGALHFREFDESLQLREVILGPECAQSLERTRALVKALCPHAVVIRSRVADKFFKVVPNEPTVPPWPQTT